jgi:hypothetical protein
VQQTRDFDLVLPDGSVEPLEVTRHVDQAAYQTWERLRRATDLSAPSLSRVWVIATPSSTLTPKGPRAYDVRKLLQALEPVLGELERNGYTSIELGRLQRELPLAFSALLDLGIQDGFSREPRPPEAAHISLGAPVGGITVPDLVAAGIEQEAGDLGNQAKLAQPSVARRRHLFVVFDSSSGAAFNAVDRNMIGRLPHLPASITTAWAATGGFVLVTTPPGPWELHELPRAVFEAPESFLTVA